MNALTETINLREGKTVRLKASRRALYRLQKLDPSLVGLPTICGLIWALQDVRNPQNTPEDFAELVDINDIEKLSASIGRVMEAALPKEFLKQNSKNGPSAA